ncbi:hypothetical protein V6N13_126014 [Hibiscus sabdariffa]|uniref:Uncharacterized protein n=2 Tax=Hibiscus sabdariffa TaxID=183260 RepID=A0ABR2NWN9_9ROSI
MTCEVSSVPSAALSVDVPSVPYELPCRSRLRIRTELHGVHVGVVSQDPKFRKNKEGKRGSVFNPFSWFKTSGCSNMEVEIEVDNEIRAAGTNMLELPNNLT